jgi:hypothetical protein
MRAGVLTGEIRENDEEALFLDVCTEIQRRSNCAGDGYPFAQTGRNMECKADAIRYAYSFCLLTSHAPDVDQEDRKLFEFLCSLALSRYMGGERYVLGEPRKLPVPASFRDAMDDLLGKLGEGQGANRKSTRTRKGDGGVDLVNWLPFRDRRVGQLIVLGNCASGGNWKGKRGETNVKRFQTYMAGKLHSTPVKAFFICDVLSDNDLWFETASYAGMVFDRARIASLIAVVKDADARVGRALETAVRRLLRQLGGTVQRRARR